MLSFLSLTQTMTKTRVWEPAGLGPWNSSRRWPVARAWPAAYWSAWERVCEEKPRKGKEQGAAMGPTNLDVTADAAHPSVCLSVCPSAHFILGGHSALERAELADLQELAESRAFHSHGLRIWQTGALDWDYRDGHWPLVGDEIHVEVLRFFSCLIFPSLSLTCLFLPFVTINFGPRHWPLGIGRLAKVIKAGWHSRTTVSVYVMYCARVQCVISFHFITYIL